MSSVDKAMETQMRNVEAKTGKSLAELTAFVNNSSLSKHNERVKLVKDTFQLGHGDANLVVHLAKKETEPTPTVGGDPVADAVQEIYAGKKAELRPIHDAVMQKIQMLGDFEIAPKKKYLSLRRKKQFAMVGPGTKGRVELGLNMNDVAATPRLESLPPGGMCPYRVFLSDVAEVNEELLGWLKIAYTQAG